MPFILFVGDINDNNRLKLDLKYYNFLDISMLKHCATGLRGRN